MSHHPRSAKRPVKPATIDRREHKARERAQPRPGKAPQVSVYRV